jgi:hypothetical protein
MSMRFMFAISCPEAPVPAAASVILDSQNDECVFMETLQDEPLECHAY